MKHFEFACQVEKAWKSDDGQHAFVRAVASDTMPDTQSDRMTKESLDRMAIQAKKGLPILETHRSVFAIGHTVDGAVMSKDGSAQFVVDIELNQETWQGKQLFEEVKSGKTDKQLSIGGKINVKNPGAVRFEQSKSGQPVRAVEDVVLDHIATTRKGQAANARTKFVSAILKSLDGDDVVDEDDEVVPGLATETATENPVGTTAVKVTPPPSVVDVKTEETELAGANEAVQGLSFLQKLGRKLARRKEEKVSKEKEAAAAALSAVGKAEGTMPIPEDGKCPPGWEAKDGMCVKMAEKTQVEPPAKAKAETTETTEKTVEKTQVEKTQPFDSAALEKTLEERFAGALEKSMSAFSAAIEKSVVAKIGEAQAEIAKAVGELQEATKEALQKSAEMDLRMEELEKAGGVSQALTGDDETPEERVEKTHKPKGVWAGAFRSAAAQARIVRR